MKDRVVEYPNRFRLIPIQGTDGISELIPAPGEITEIGTPVSKSTLLSDEAEIAIWGNADDRTPNHAFIKIMNKASTAMDEINSKFEKIDENVSRRCVVKAGAYSGNGQYSQHIDMGFPVEAVLIENSVGSRNESWNAATVGGLAVKGGALEHGGVLAAVSGNGFDVYTRGQYQGDFNGVGRYYYYVAWGMEPIM